MQHANQNDTIYSNKDPEHIRQSAVSSAGLPTQPLIAHLPPDEPPMYPVSPDDKRTDALAIALIVLGLLALLAQYAPSSDEIMGGMVLLTIASCFLFFAFWQRIYGLLIPGCILAGLSVGVTLASVTNGISVLWGLALGFVAILLIGRSMFHLRSNWPIYPAIPLFAVGIIVAMSTLPSMFALSLVWLPLLLIAAGLFLGWRRTAHR